MIIRQLQLRPRLCRRSGNREKKCHMDKISCDLHALQKLIVFIPSWHKNLACLTRQFFFLSFLLFFARFTFFALEKPASREMWNWVSFTTSQTQRRNKGSNMTSLKRVATSQQELSEFWWLWPVCCTTRWDIDICILCTVYTIQCWTLVFAQSNQEVLLNSWVWWQNLTCMSLVDLLAIPMDSFMM